MNNPDDWDNNGSHGPARRAVLASLLAAYAGSSIPRAFAAPASDAAGDDFMPISKTLTGRAALDPAQSERLYEALSAEDRQFPEKVQALLALVEQRRIDPLRLQHVLDTEHRELAPLPRDILTAWYIGVVGQSENARCVTFETSLMNVIVRDQLRPPSYCFGVYGSWTQKPV